MYRWCFLQSLKRAEDLQEGIFVQGTRKFVLDPPRRYNIKGKPLDPIERQRKAVRDLQCCVPNISFKLSQSVENALSGKSIRLKGASYAACAQNILCDLERP